MYQTDMIARSLVMKRMQELRDIKEKERRPLTDSEFEELRQLRREEVVLEHLARQFNWRLPVQDFEDTLDESVISFVTAEHYEAQAKEHRELREILEIVKKYEKEGS